MIVDFILAMSFMSIAAWSIGITIVLFVVFKVFGGDAEAAAAEYNYPITFIASHKSGGLPNTIDINADFENQPNPSKPITHATEREINAALKQLLKSGGSIEMTIKLGVFKKMFIPKPEPTGTTRVYYYPI